MTTKKIWFGNAEKMMWVNCPSTNITRGRARWQETGTYLNGGAFEKSSAYGHRKYGIDWNLMRSEEAAKIIAFYEGVYGQSPIQFVDPFAAKSNILPLHWSTPRLCAGNEAPSLGTSGAAVTESATVYSTIPGTPTRSATFALPAFASGKTHTINVPPGYVLHFGYSASASCVQLNGVTVAPSSTALFTNSVNNISGADGVNATLRVGLTSAGSATINRMSAVLTKSATAPVGGVFRQGEGNTGLKFVGEPRRTGYSSVMDLESVSAEFVEVGAWQ